MSDPGTREREALEALIDRIPATANAEREYDVVSDALRELAVARQTIRSLQDALAAEHRDDSRAAVLLGEMRAGVAEGSWLDQQIGEVLAALASSSSERDPVAGRGSHAPLTDAELGERLYRAEADVVAAREREQELTNALQRIESAAVTCVERLAAGHKPPTSGTELDPQRILDLVRAALARVEASSTRQSSEHDSDCSCLVCDPDDSPAVEEQR